jgi:hypothetical protein
MERMIEKQQFRAEMMRPPSQLPKWVQCIHLDVSGLYKNDVYIL